ncbi:MAG: hypothetical protein EOP62_15490 [Sphingomonadales bacterium]|nr:MAG: hypothetical protein EOP62_15490 [Sphingomonadales bacterium]
MANKTPADPSAATGERESAVRPTLAPSGWAPADREHWWTVQQAAQPGNPPARGTKGAVSTALHALASRVGLEALRQGGSAMDAVLATALTQIVLGGGAVISYFGIFHLMYHEASSGETTSLNAGWNTVLGEDDPLSIPGKVNPGADTLEEMLGDAPPSGRTALVGGFMRGLEEAHRRYGKLPFDRLFEAAIELAEDGFPMSPGLIRYIEMRGGDLKRLPETRSIFFKPDGSNYAVGDHFRQPALAETLRRVARDGADYMYTGSWAARCIAAIQADGGKMTLEDLSRYRPIWSEPVTLDRANRTLALLGHPCEGSVTLVEALNLATAAGLEERPHWSQSGDSLVRIAKCCAAAVIGYGRSQEEQEALCPGVNMDPRSRLTQANAEKLWAVLESQPPVAYQPRVAHSDDVVAIDVDGNMASLCHSINCLTWGRTAIVVDGVSIGDPASFQQPKIAATPRGEQLPNPIELGLVLKEGQPEIAWSSMGVGLHYQATMSLLNVIDHRMTIVEAADAPRLLLPLAPGGDPTRPVMRVIEGEFPERILDETGLDVRRIAPAEARFAQGLWVAIQRDTQSGDLVAISPSYTNGQASAC